MNQKVFTALQDLLHHTEVVSRLVASGKDSYDHDEWLRYAAESLIIRMGESVERIAKADPDFIADNPELELRKLKDSRNVLAHGYDIVDSEIVWTILANHIPRVANQIQAKLMA
ncbi:MAG: DUF86 domain-containing protein [Propionibacteriaceae bacterium]|nr:DUF86 domain-containing protein [Propionibacteriaceae bacterium]